VTAEGGSANESGESALLLKGGLPGSRMKKWIGGEERGDAPGGVGKGGWSRVCTGTAAAAAAPVERRPLSGEVDVSREVCAVRG